MTPSITQTMINTALGNFLSSVLQFPSGQVVVGQVNRVPEPKGDFCIMWPLHRPRLATNVDTSQDCKFTGSITGTAMTVINVARGTITPGNDLFGVGVIDGTTIVAQLNGTPGGVGTYSVSAGQEIASQTLSAGTTAIEASTEIVMQVDVHGPNSSDNAQTIFQLLRDAYGVEKFSGTGVSPLYADDPRQAPFINAAKQYEYRWTVDVHLQATPVISVPQEYADEAIVNPLLVPNQLQPEV